MTGPTSRPVIGISTYEETATWRGWHRRASLVPTDFVSGIAEAGAIPVLLPPYGSDAEAQRVVAGLDGVLIVGGADIDPARYGQQRTPHTGAPAPERDEWEAALVRSALAEDLPVLGVCRGMQMLNIVHGGTLLQHLPTDRGTEAHQPADPQFARIEIRMSAAHLPGSVLGPHRSVGCFHHQATATVGDGLEATGWAADGTIETIADPARDFVVGVQWHPEIEPDRQLFAAFVRAAGQRRTSGPAPAGDRVEARS